jgi:hypothetical protein
VIKEKVKKMKIFDDQTSKSFSSENVTALSDIFFPGDFDCGPSFFSDILDCIGEVGGVMDFSDIGVSWLLRSGPNWGEDSEFECGLGCDGLL